MASQRRLGLQNQEQTSWTDDLTVCHLSGIGYGTNRIYQVDGTSTEAHSLEDGWLRFREDECFLYGVFNGYDGSRVSQFVTQRLTAELLLGQLTLSRNDADVRKVLLQAFDVVERSFFESIDDSLAEKANLHSQLPEGIPHSQLPQQYQKLLEKLHKIEQEIAGGTTAIVALILNNKLYIANIGTSRALLCKSTADGQLQVTQVSVDHTTDNEDELFRLSQLGLDVAKIKQCGLIGGQDSSRRIGDYRMKYCYNDVEMLSPAKTKPVIAEPEIHGGQSLDGVTGFLVLMTDGLYKALEAAHGPGQANQEIAAMVATEFALQTRLEAVAQAVVDRVRRIHRDTFISGGERSKFCERHEDMTLLVRNFHYPLGEMSQTSNSPTQGGRIYPVSVPYTSTQGTLGKTSVTLSLVMPSQNQMMNGNHSNSTGDETTPTLTNSQSPTATLQSTNTHTHSSSSSSGDGQGHLFHRHRLPHTLQPDQDGRVEPYVDFLEFYRLWTVDHSEQTVAGAQ